MTPQDARPLSRSLETCNHARVARLMSKHKIVSSKVRSQKSEVAQGAFKMSDQPIAVFDKIGDLMAFMFDTDFVNISGRYTARLINDSVFAWSGQHLGWWEGECLRGHDGGVIVWTIGANLGMYLPKPFTGIAIPKPQSPQPSFGWPNFNLLPRPADLNMWSSEAFPVF